MEANMETLFTAAALFVVTVLTMLIEKFRRENKRDHGYVRSRLDDIHDDVKQVNSRLDNHIDWHMDGTKKVEPPKRARKRAPKTTLGQS